MQSGRIERLYGAGLEIEDVLTTKKPQLGGNAGSMAQRAFAVQADVRKKALWGQWAECAMAGAHDRRGRETLRTNGGNDERAAAVVADSEQRTG